MPTEYTNLVSALADTGYPCAEYGWKTRPDGTYLVVGLDYEAGKQEGDGVKTDRSFSVSVDAFFAKLSDRAAVAGKVEAALASCLGDSWELNSIQHETETGLFHIEWVGEVFGTITAPPEPVPDTEPEATEDGDA